MKKITVIILLVSLALGLNAKSQGGFVRVEGTNLVKPDGTRLYIQGTNLGNWLNPEGYMFGFTKANSAWMINQVLCQLVGTDATADFWAEFKDNYITRRDIDFIASTGCTRGLGGELVQSQRSLPHSRYARLSERADGRQH